MNNFETVIILSPEISSTKLSEELDKFKNLINSSSGKVVDQENWGLRDLSYSINKFNKAFYNFFQIEIDGKKINNFKKELNQNDNILRYIFIKVENHQTLPTKLAYEKK